MLSWLQIIFFSLNQNGKKMNVRLYILKFLKLGILLNLSCILYLFLYLENTFLFEFIYVLKQNYIITQQLIWCFYNENDTLLF